MCWQKEKKTFSFFLPAFFLYFCDYEYRRFVNIDIFDFCNIKCHTEQIADLIDRYEGIKPGYHMNKKHWISVCFNKDVSDKMIKELVKQSYDIVVASLSKKEKAALD